jgi:hypothetical protein
MKRQTLVYAALSMPLGVMAVIAAPLILAGWGKPIPFPMLWPVLVSFGLPQYLVFAPLLALVSRRCNATQIVWLMLAAPLLFVPFLVAPFLATQSSTEDMIGVTLLVGGAGLAVGYLCVALAFGLWGVVRLLEDRSEVARPGGFEPPTF